MAPESCSGYLGLFEYQLTRAIFLDELGPEDNALWQSFLAMNGRAYWAIRIICQRETPGKGDFAPFGMTCVRLRSSSLV